jgi:hypothetical protein
MKRKWISSIFLPLLGMIFVLAFAYGGTVLNQALAAYGNRFLDVNMIAIAVWTNALITFLSIGATILLFWEIMTHTIRSRWVGWIFLIVGLFLNLLPIIPILLYILFRIQSVGWGFIPTLLINPTPNSTLSITEAVVAVIGLLIIILPRRPSIDMNRAVIHSQPPVL